MQKTEYKLNIQAEAIDIILDALVHLRVDLPKNGYSPAEASALIDELSRISNQLRKAKVYL